ncbi:hypothetical protein MD484_g3106, partial [Candolleomyces efflorescens]
MIMSTPPVERLPVELLGEIFALCLPEKAHERIDPKKPPMVLCKVSSYWYQAALSEPRLWDTVIFPSGQSIESSRFWRHQKFIKAGGVQRWFDRTGPSHLLAFGEEATLHRQTSHLDLFLPIVTKYARRLRHISITLPKRRLLEVFRRGFPYGIFDNLESVAISCGLEMEPAQLQAFLLLDTPFNTARKLKHVSLMLEHPTPLKFILPWPQLETLEVRCVDSSNPLNFSQWRELFEKCTDIKSATFVNPSRSGEDEDLPALEHQALTHLRLTVREEVWIDWEMLYKPVSFPNLRHLEFDYEDEDSAISPPMLLKAVTRKALSNLQTLTFHSPADQPYHIPPDVDRIVEQLAEHPTALPSLTHITLPYRNFRLYDIALMLLPRRPTIDHPGLTASVRVILNRGKEKYNRVLETMPEVAGRYRLVELARAPSCDPEHEDWEASDQEPDGDMFS